MNWPALVTALCGFVLGVIVAWRPRFLERRSMRRLIAAAGVQTRATFAREPARWFSMYCNDRDADTLELHDDLKRCGFLRLGGCWQGMVCVNFAGEISPVDPRPMYGEKA